MSSVAPLALAPRPGSGVVVVGGVLVLVAAFDVLVGGALQVALPTTLDLPVGHARHAAAEVAPVRGAYVFAVQLRHGPGGQSRHTLDHVPAAHGLHAIAPCTTQSSTTHRSRMSKRDTAYICERELGSTQRLEALLFY